MAEGKYYWLRLDRNFFKRHDIRIIESMENGKEYVLFYMKLLLESIDHEGSLRFNDLIPYNDAMLSTITNTNIDIVRSAVKVFKSLDMLEILDDQTIYITDTQKMLGEAKSTDRVKRFREKQQTLLLGGELSSEVCAYCGGVADTIDHIIPRAKGGKDTPSNIVAACRRCNSSKYQKNVSDFINDNTENLDIDLIKSNSKIMSFVIEVDGIFSMKRFGNVTETENETEIEKEIEKEIDNMGAKSTRFKPPTLEEVTAYCKEKQNGVDPVKWWNFYDSKNWYVGKNKMSRWKSAIATWSNSADKPLEQEKPKPKKYRPVVINGETVMEEVDE